MSFHASMEERRAAASPGTPTVQVSTTLAIRGPASARPPTSISISKFGFIDSGRLCRSDKYSIGKEFPRIAEISLKSSEDGQYILATVANGDGGEFALYLLGADHRWIQVATLADQVISGSFGDDGYLYLLSRQHAPKGKVLKVALREPQASRAKTVVPESDIAVSSIVPAGGYLYVQGVSGGPSEVRIYNKNGSPAGKLPIEANSAIYQVAKYQHDSVLFQSASYLHPATWYRFDPSTRVASPTRLRETAAADYSDIVVTREFATSKDGTRVPLTILRRKGVPLDGKNPALLTGYGGFGISLPPFYDPTLRPLFDRGVVFAVANLRGGGEYGEEWHRAGSLTHKQNVFDDFDACSRFLIEKGYTSAGRLAIIGGSNGGLLMGAAFTQHPELYCAVVSMVGIYDMLRTELSANGRFNVTEYGTVKEPDQFRALFAYSPYHHVRDGTQYPAVLFTTGANDPRVDPMQSRKMAARLQASASRKPVLLRTSSGSGHGFGTALSERIDELTDVDAFLFAQWGIK